jgi:hypothetical protein
MASKMRQESERIVDLIQKYKKQEHNLGGLLKESSAEETHLVQFMEDELEELDKKSTYLIFNNNDVMESHAESEGHADEKEGI